jgi:hypothetical protein
VKVNLDSEAQRAFTSGAAEYLSEQLSSAGRSITTAR